MLLGEDVLPGKEELFVRGSDRADVGLFAAGADQQLVRVEQLRLALSQSRLLRLLPLVAVPHQLLERLEHRVRREHVCFLALDHCQRQAVHEQHDVGDDEAFGRSRCVDAKLVDGVELVSLGMLEVDQLDVRVLLAGQFVGIDLGTEQQLENGFIVSDQAAARVTEQIIVQVVELLVRQPLSAIGGGVDRTDGVVEHISNRDFPKAGPQAFRRVGGNARPLVDHRPVEGVELIEERLFDEGAFRHC